MIWFSTRTIDTVSTVEQNIFVSNWLSELKLKAICCYDSIHVPSIARSRLEQARPRCRWTSIAQQIRDWYRSSNSIFVLFVSFVVPIFPRPVDCVLSGERWTSPSTRSDVTLKQTSVRVLLWTSLFPMFLNPQHGLEYSRFAIEPAQSFADR